MARSPPTGLALAQTGPGHMLYGTVPAAPAAALLDTPYQYTLVPGELYEGPNMELSAMPAALALTFTYNGHTYTCTAYPAEVTP